MNGPEENKVNSGEQPLPSHQDGTKIVEGANETDQLDRSKESAIKGTHEPAAASQSGEASSDEI
jgi:hypothetical protein